jgi:DUF1009 family protein
MIAVIAGTGSLPRDACKSLQAQQHPFFVMSLFPEDNGEELISCLPSPDHLVSLPFYKVGLILDTLKKRGTTRVLFIGKVDKRNLFKKVSFDWLFFKLSAKLIYRNDSQIMEVLIDELAHHGIDVMHQSEVLASLFIPPGLITGKRTPELEHDIKLGMQVATLLSQADIGQTVVVKEGAVIAVEAIEGTDECIARSVTLGQSNLVICKTARPTQNTKFDLPTLGPRSLKPLVAGQVAAIVWQSERTFIAQKEQFIADAKAKGITLISL